MKRKAFVLLVLSMALLSCGNNSNSCETKSKHVVELSTDNFAIYFDYYLGINKSNQNFYGLTMSGCLDYAFYDNCRVSVQQTSANFGDKVYRMELNAHGNGELQITNYYDAVNSISEITGTIIYWI